MQNATTRTLLLLAVQAAGCSGPSTSTVSENPTDERRLGEQESTTAVPENPTGECSPEDQNRKFHDGPAGPEWVPDCENPLTREYWRVRLPENGKAYVLPRPDGAPELAVPCGDDGHPLHDAVTKYGLCSTATGAEAVELVNSMDVADALSITHYMHTVLRFGVQPEEGGERITPFAFSTDVADACALHENDAALQMGCDAYVAADENSVGAHPFAVGTGARLAARLNELYGIE